MNRIRWLNSFQPWPTGSDMILQHHRIRMPLLHAKNIFDKTPWYSWLSGNGISGFCIKGTSLFSPRTFPFSSVRYRRSSWLRTAGIASRTGSVLQKNLKKLYNFAHCAQFIINLEVNNIPWCWIWYRGAAMAASMTRHGVGFRRTNYVVI